MGSGYTTLSGYGEASFTEKKSEFAFRPVGQGVQDFKSITAAAVECGAEWMIVEQDNTYDIPSVDAAKMSREYLRSIGF